MNQPLLRPARPDEAAALSALALRAKASWGYSADFIEACRAELTLSAARIAAGDVWVAEVAGAPAGSPVAGLLVAEISPPTAELAWLYVDPACQGQGIGRALMTAFLDLCRARGATRATLDADPHAEAIYARWGFRTVSRSPSGSIPGRVLPRMELRL